MKWPRFKLRSLVLLIAFLAMALTIGVLTVENRRLRVAAQQTRAETMYALLVERYKAVSAAAQQNAARPSSAKTSATAGGK